ncbi:transposase [Sphingomonas sp. LR61]|uniref:transposase n=1 Tax=Sphingomonas sp. LR61 TaxID=3050234 RepID=UPI003FA6C21F
MILSDEAWAVIGSLVPMVKATGRPPVDRRVVVEATAQAASDKDAPGRDVPERFGNWNTIYKSLNRWAGRRGLGAGAGAPGGLSRSAVRRTWTGSPRSAPRSCARASARRDPPAGHGGLCRITRSSVTSPPIMRSAALVAA